MAVKGLVELLKLERIAESRRSELEQPDQALWKGVAFEVAGEHYVAPIGEISEVIASPEVLTPVPLSKPWLKGVANVRGQILPVVDLSKFLKIDIRASTDKRSKKTNQKVLVIKQQGVLVGLQVDAVSHIKKFSSDQYLPKNLPPSSPFLPYSHGQFAENDQQWPVFMPSLFIQDPRFLEPTGY